jgi:hypothetical protein
MGCMALHVRFIRPQLCEKVKHQLSYSQWFSQLPTLFVDDITTMLRLDAWHLTVTGFRDNSRAWLIQGISLINKSFHLNVSIFFFMMLFE